MVLKCDDSKNYLKWLTIHSISANGLNLKKYTISPLGSKRIASKWDLHTFVEYIRVHITFMVYRRKGNLCKAYDFN